jgi:hypothetical protein
MNDPQNPVHYYQHWAADHVMSPLVSIAIKYWNEKTASHKLPFNTISVPSW